MTRTVIETLIIIMGATIVLACFQSGNLLTWTYDQPPSDAMDGLISLAEQWHELMLKLGPAEITATIREQVIAITE